MLRQQYEHLIFFASQRCNPVYKNTLVLYVLVFQQEELSETYFTQGFQ